MIRNRTREIKPTMLSVYDGQECQRFVLERASFEAFDRDGKSLGLFATQRDAVLAIPKGAPAQ